VSLGGWGKWGEERSAVDQGYFDEKKWGTGGTKKKKKPSNPPQPPPVKTYPEDAFIKTREREAIIKTLKALGGYNFKGAGQSKSTQP